MPPGILLLSQLAVILGLVVSLFQLVRLAQSRMLHTTLRKAIERDSDAAAELIDRLDRRGRTGNDDRNGLVLVALGIALAGFGLILNDSATRFVSGAALFPALVGAALLLRARFARRETGEPGEA